MKNTRIMVWSGGGEGYARKVVNALGIEKDVDEYGDKGYGGYDANGHPIFHTDLKPDIAFDDIEEFSLGTLNLVVQEKDSRRATCHRRAGNTAWRIGAPSQTRAGAVHEINDRPSMAGLRFEWRRQAPTQFLDFQR
jgi:hypothetical protein